MRLSHKYPIPSHLALLYEFVNSLSLRRFVEHGTAHKVTDELHSPKALKEWMRARELLRSGEHIKEETFAAALELRQHLRDFLSVPPEARQHSPEAARLLETTSRFPLLLGADRKGQLELIPASGTSHLSRVLVELHGLARSGELDRLKTCASEECQWIFFDRSKPGTRRWCSSVICGNRDKTRHYRARHRSSIDGQ